MLIDVGRYSRLCGGNRIVASVGKCLSFSLSLSLLTYALHVCFFFVSRDGGNERIGVGCCGEGKVVAFLRELVGQ